MGRGKILVNVVILPLTKSTKLTVLCSFDGVFLVVIVFITSIALHITSLTVLYVLAVAVAIAIAIVTINVIAIVIGMEFGLTMGMRRGSVMIMKAFGWLFWLQFVRASK